MSGQPEGSCQHVCRLKSIRKAVHLHRVRIPGQHPTNSPPKTTTHINCGYLGPIKHPERGSMCYLGIIKRAELDQAIRAVSSISTSFPSSRRAAGPCVQQASLWLGHPREHSHECCIPLSVSSLEGGDGNLCFSLAPREQNTLPYA